MMWTHYTFLRKVVSPCGEPGSPTPKHVRLSAHELNTGTGAFAPPPRLRGSRVDNPDCGLPASVPGYPPVNLPTAGAPPHGLIDLFPPDSLPPSDWTAIGGAAPERSGGGGGEAPGAGGRRPRRSGAIVPLWGDCYVCDGRQKHRPLDHRERRFAESFQINDLRGGLLT